MSEFVDTNIFVRLLARDDPVKLARSQLLFERAARGEVELFTCEAVVLEVVQVLESKRLYAMPRPHLAKVVRSVLDIKGLRVDHKTTIISALDLYETSSLEFADCLAVEHCRRLGLTAIYSYDRDFDRAPGVRRLEP
jgi:predicted nucleic-acid-binding protein